ncbi:MAG: restriction endonuclease subunit S [Anaerolineales bacterium]
MTSNDPRLRKGEASAEGSLGTSELRTADASPQRRDPLPSGWRWAKLGDVMAETQPGFASGERDPKGVIQLRMNNVDTRGNLIWDAVLRVPAGITAIEKFQLTVGDVVFNNTNSTELVGKSAFFDGYSEPVVYSNHFTRLRVVPEQLDSRYLACWLLLQWQLRVFENLCNRWIGQSAVQSDKLLALEIPLPPLAEQQRIAAVLNEQMAAVAQARAAAQAQLAAVEQLPGALLRRAFSGEL